MEVILWSTTPGLIAVLLLGFGIKEEKIPAAHAVVTLLPLSRSALSLPVRRYLLVLMLFAIARASETFIVLLGHQLGIGIVALLLFWARHFAIVSGEQYLHSCFYFLVK
jgi:hypothetical protein